MVGGTPATRLGMKVADQIWQTLEDQGFIPPDFVERDSGLNLYGLIVSDVIEALGLEDK